ncbi:MAG: hypothetical protein QM661_06430 [Solimonas sp.]
MVSYQAQLDRMKQLGVPPETDPVLGAQAAWDRVDLMAIARSEIDNTVDLKRLIDASPAPLLELALTPDEESIIRLGPDLSAQLKRKIDTMSAHWRDDDRLSSVPNP